MMVYASVMQGDQLFHFETMIAALRAAISTFPDNRVGKNIRYELLDAAAGAFSVFFTQCDSFLAHQELMEKRYGLSNAKTLFGMRAIPSDTHIRELLDEVPPDHLDAVFEKCIGQLFRNGVLNRFRSGLGLDGKDLLIALDGTWHVSSEKISCDQCSRKTKNGRTIYSHGMVNPAIVYPGNSHIFCLPPEFITPRDGSKKQDCEHNASKRWIEKHASFYLQFGGITFVGDDLYSHEPMCKEMLDAGCNFILVCKPDSHKTLYEWTKGIRNILKTETREGHNKHYEYRYDYVESVPIKDGKKALLVNFIEVTVMNKKTGTKVYHNAFITNHPLTETTIPLIVSAGRARWKTENENNNTLKNHGYNLEHNYGHGKKYLASLLATLNILAYLFHTILEFMNETYKLLRTVIGSRKRFFNDMRTLLSYFCFRSFNNLMQFMEDGLKKPHLIEEVTIPI
jgi:hypothetical protein